MVPRVDIVAVDVDTGFPELVKLLVEEGHSRLPVYQDDLDHIIGMVHVKDVLGFVAARRTATLQSLLRKVLFLAPSTPVLDLLSQMRQQRVHMAFVVDEFGGIDGLITIEDLVEEIVGEIEDEHDEGEPIYILSRPDGTLLVDARTPIELLGERIGIDLVPSDDEEEIDTIGGLIVTLAGHVPTSGEIIRHPSGVEFEILGADERRVRRVRVAVPSEEAEDDDGA
jgi:CBS domain containing-hemolysin-like protein